MKGAQMELDQAARSSKAAEVAANGARGVAAFGQVMRERINVVTMPLTRSELLTLIGRLAERAAAALH